MGVPGAAAAFSASTSSAVGRVASSDAPRMKAEIDATVSDAASAALRGASIVASVDTTPAPRCRSSASIAEIRFPLFLASLPSIPAPRDHVGLIVEPQAAMLAQHLARRLEIAPVAHHTVEPRVFDLRDVNRGVPGGERGRGADRFRYLGGQRVHLVAEQRAVIRVGVEVEIAS